MEEIVADGEKGKSFTRFSAKKKMRGRGGLGNLGEVISSFSNTFLY